MVLFRVDEVLVTDYNKSPGAVLFCWPVLFIMVYKMFLLDHILFVISFYLFYSILF